MKLFSQRVDSVVVVHEINFTIAEMFCSVNILLSMIFIKILMAKALFISSCSFLYTAVGFADLRIILFNID